MHQLLIEETGGSPALRDVNLLDSALENAFATFDGKELYPTKEEKAARLGFGLISNHAFVDGNKRIGMYVMLSFLAVNGIQLYVDDQDIIDIALAVASGNADYAAVLQWIRNHE